MLLSRLVPLPLPASTPPATRPAQLASTHTPPGDRFLRGPVSQPRFGDIDLSHLQGREHKRLHDVADEMKILLSSPLLLHPGHASDYAVRDLGRFFGMAGELIHLARHENALAALAQRPQDHPALKKYIDNPDTYPRVRDLARQLEAAGAELSQNQAEAIQTAIFYGLFAKLRYQTRKGQAPLAELHFQLPHTPHGRFIETFYRDMQGPLTRNGIQADNPLAIDDWFEAILASLEAHLRTTLPEAIPVADQPVNAKTLATDFTQTAVATLLRPKINGEWFPISNSLRGYQQALATVSQLPDAMRRPAADKDVEPPPPEGATSAEDAPARAADCCH